MKNLFIILLVLIAFVSCEETEVMESKTETIQIGQWNMNDDNSAYVPNLLIDEANIIEVKCFIYDDRGLKLTLESWDLHRDELRGEIMIINNQIVLKRNDFFKNTWYDDEINRGYIVVNYMN